VVSELNSWAYAVLNKKFRNFAQIVDSMFPLHEYHPEEVPRLVALCRMIQREGYQAIEKSLPDKQFSATFNTATEYGAFVRAEIGDAYLGLFVAAQMLTKPLASAGFATAMVRSSVYQSASHQTQGIARFLMFLVSSARMSGMNRSGKKDTGDFVMDLAELHMETLDMNSVLRSLKS
jgi:hypothetical protein